MMVGQAKVVGVEEKWSYLGTVLNVGPTGFAGGWDVWNAERSLIHHPSKGMFIRVFLNTEFIK